MRGGGGGEGGHRVVVLDEGNRRSEGVHVVALDPVPEAEPRAPRAQRRADVGVDREAGQKLDLPRPLQVPGLRPATPRCARVSSGNRRPSPVRANGLISEGARCGARWGGGGAACTRSKRLRHGRDEKNPDQYECLRPRAPRQRPARRGGHGESTARGGGRRGAVRRGASVCGQSCSCASGEGGGGMVKLQ